MEKIIHKNKNEESKVPYLVTAPYTIDPRKRKIDLTDFIYIPQKKVFITKDPYTLSYNWKDSHFFLQDLGLFMPDISTFMLYYMNIRDASQDRNDLFYADGSKVPISKAYSAWRKLTGGESKRAPDTVTWLDNLWDWQTEPEQKEQLVTYTNHKVTKTTEGWILKGRKKVFDNPFEKKYPYVCKLPLSDNGLPISGSSYSEQVPGITLFFDFPEKGRASQFKAEDFKSQILNDIDPFTGWANHIFGCANSTRSIKI